MKDLWSYINTLDLRFNDKVIERKYENSKRKHQKMILTITLCFGIAIGFLAWLLNPFKKHSYIGIFFIYKVFIAIITILVIFLLRKKSLWMDHIIAFITLFYSVGVMQLTLNDQSSWNFTKFFLRGIWSSCLEFFSYRKSAG